MKNNIEEKINKLNEKLLETKLFKIPFIRKIYTTFMNKQVILYLIFGVLTTAINILSFYISSEFIFKMLDTNFNIAISNLTAFVIAVIFAFITNKKFVFENKTETKKQTFIQFISFIFARVFTFLISTFGILLFVNMLFIHKYIAKIVFNIIEVILNYIFSKIIVFKKQSK